LETVQDRGMDAVVKFLRFFWKTTPYDKIFKILFRKFSSRHRSMCCVQISWNLVYGKSEIVSCLPARKKNKFCLAIQLLLLRGSRPKSIRAAPDNVFRVQVITSRKRCKIETQLLQTT